MKHMGVLREAQLLTTRAEGRRRLNSLNVVPLRQIYDRWMSGFQDLWASQLVRLKHDVEGAQASGVSAPRLRQSEKRRK